MPDSPPHDPEAMQAAEPQAQPIEVMTGLVSAGFAKLSRQRRKVLRIVLAATLAVHVIALLVFGGIVVARYFSEEEAVFEAPPPTRTYQPREVEMKVKVQNRQRSSSRPAFVPRLVSSKPSNITLPEIKVDPKLVTTTFQPKFKAVSGKGLGAGLGGGHGLGGFGEGVSAVNFFGVRAKGERIAILVDVSVSMIEEQRGSFTGYLRVKQRVNDVIDSLKDGTLFNVIVFADACSVMDEKMVYANDETRGKAKLFLRPFNTEGNYGLDVGNYTGARGGLRATGGTTRLDLALSAAMENGADTILIISDGLPQVQKAHDPQVLQAQQARIAQWNQQNAGAIAAYEQAYANAPVERVWVPEQPARPPSKAPLKEGMKADPGSPAIPGHWAEVRQCAAHRPAPPERPPPPMWTLSDFIAHISQLYETTHKPNGLKSPQINCIGYQIDREGGAFLNDLARHYKGQYRLVRKLR
jgi:hypothetical protein